VGKSTISDGWDRCGGRGLSSRVLGSVRPEVPLKSRIDLAQKKLEVQITKLDSIQSKLQKKHDMIFERIVAAQRSSSHSYAKAYATELSQVRKMKTMVSSAKLSMEQIQLRLNTVSELGDVVVTLSPCMSIIRGLSSSISGIMPEANASMQDLSSILGDVMGSSSVGSIDAGAGDHASPEAGAILAEVQSVLESKTKSSIPDIPDNLKAGARQRARTLI